MMNRCLYCCYNCKLAFNHLTVIITIGCVFWLMGSNTAIGQNNTIKGAVITRDTTGVATTDSIRVAKQQKKSKPFFSPALKAATWALLPGAGHIYNKQYLKAGIYSVGTVTMAGYTVQKWNNYAAARNNYLAAYYAGADAATLQPLFVQKVEAKKPYSTALGLTIALHSVNVLDAYISQLAKKDTKKHSPTRAGYYSGILPGLGQAYNRQYVKIPFIYIGLAAGGYWFYESKRQFLRYTDAYLYKTYGYSYDSPDPLLLQYYDAQSLLIYRRAYQQQIELSIIITSVWYMLNIADAVVFAHLKDFDISNDLSFTVRPTLLPLSENYNRKNHSIANNSGAFFASVTPGLQVHLNIR
ncbi:MAG: hypothetical protein IPI59_06105 [Sphingobacteriales bacterium]|jgi:hypothetical protein|nr:hypothetical protein [Sphingobacteriales bacterium]MBP9142310.1 hypothetical protein [Chitinophagales bacterium]MDA0199184.1 DUF5683 domain-containing protein [Bacteroidota bacterium]MBK6891053.1 hypothetical protein [Sphingobacteriales bacterium]MBK7527117.1 hypothetical protein [Sphingobacteriales bacterium]